MTAIQPEATWAQGVGVDAAATDHPPEASTISHRSAPVDTWGGATGGVFIVDPGMAKPGALRIQLALDRYVGRGFLHPGERVEQERQYLSVNWVPVERLELYASLQNRTTFVESADATRSSAHTLGDALIGAKFGIAPAPLVRFGIDARLLLRNDIRATAWLWPAPSLGLRGSLAFDLQRLRKPAPLIVRLNLDYLFDGSSALLPDANRRLPSRIERFGLALGTTDSFTLGWGLEAPLRLATWLSLQPTLEYRLSIPVGGRCPAPAVASAGQPAPPAPEDPCFANARPSFAAWPMNLTAGLRVLPGAGVASFLVGLDVGLGGTERFANEVVPNPPYRFLFAFGYGFGVAPVASHGSKAAPDRLADGVAGRRSGRASPKAQAKPRDGASAAGELSLSVRDQAGAPVAGARVELAGASSQTGSTDAEGRVAFRGLAPGPYQARVDADSYLLQVLSLQLDSPGGGHSGVTLAAKPVPPKVALAQGEIRIGGVRFEANSPAVRAESAVVMAELADFMLRNPSIERVRIQAHGRGRLAQSRALAIQQALIRAGVEAARLEVTEEPTDRVVLLVLRTSAQAPLPASK